MAHVYSDVTVVFSGGGERQFAEVVVHADGSLSGEISHRVEVPEWLEGRAWQGDPVTAIETVHYAPHAWREVRPRTPGALYVAVREPGNVFGGPLRIIQISGSAGSATDVAALIGDWLAREAGHYGSEFHAELADGNRESTGVVPARPTEALSATYVIADDDLGETDVRFFLVRPADVNPPGALVHF
ncbi:hypothetical protein BKG74_22890 [Mycobacteroides chelonae]|uniref:hypothetical protein n=1 Tax=Mycobacteroides chelonae TaxID=1774 RepID=UPI0008A8ED5E|nr:hypothetical protein [Mycobacteroides chelonae]OHU10940.1 hypothetical protein BKG74_22890 [Mycobacteroides chelonae]